MSSPTLSRQDYWRGQLRRTAMLLAVWAIVAFVISIFLAETLNSFTFGGVPFGFWMAQQGSIFVFVVLILIYAITSDKAERAAGLQETDDTMSTASDAH